MRSLTLTRTKRSTNLLRLAVAAFVPWISAWAGAAEGIGFVNVPAIMDKAPQSRDAREKLEREFSSRRKKLQECGEEIDNLDRTLRRDGREMKKSDRDRMIDRVRKKRRECGDFRQEFEADFNKRRGEELDTLQKQVSGVIKEIAEKRKLKLILGPPIVYADEEVNLTQEVLDALSREYDR